jgi:hypothetical protein
VCGLSAVYVLVVCEVVVAMWGGTLVAGRLSMACAIIASNLSKHGSPNPMGIFVTTPATTPPVESCASFTSRINVDILHAEPAWGQRTVTSSSHFQAS